MKQITGKHIRRLRQEMNMTQKQFLAVIGMKEVSWLSAIETGRVPVSARVGVIYRMLENQRKPVVEATN